MASVIKQLRFRCDGTFLITTESITYRASGFGKRQDAARWFFEVLRLIGREQRFQSGAESVPGVPLSSIARALAHLNIDFIGNLLNTWRQAKKLAGKRAEDQKLRSKPRVIKLVAVDGRSARGIEAKERADVLVLLLPEPRSDGHDLYFSLGVAGDAIEFEDEDQTNAGPRDASVPGMLDLAELIGFGPHADVKSTFDRLGSRQPAIGRTIFMWLSDRSGLAPSQVRVDTRWDRSVIPSEGSACPPLAAHEGPIAASIARVLRDPEIAGILVSRPKVWIKSWKPQVIDSRDLVLELGGSDFRINKCLERMFVEPGLVPPTGRPGETLKDLYDRGIFNLEDDLPNMAAVVLIVRITADQDGPRVLVVQRARVDYSPGAYSVSCEEQFDPSKDSQFHDTIRRCLSEEFGLDASNGVHLRDEQIRCLGFGREWGLYWNTVLVYAVDIDCTSDHVLRCWHNVPRDKQEAWALTSVSVASVDDRIKLLRMLREENVTPAWFDRCPKSGRAFVASKWHPTLTKARGYLGLRYWSDGEPELRRWVKELGDERTHATTA
jgi:hypothetical protein